MPAAPSAPAPPRHSGQLWCTAGPAAMRLLCDQVAQQAHCCWARCAPLRPTRAGCRAPRPGNQPTPTAPPGPAARGAAGGRGGADRPRPRGCRFDRPGAAARRRRPSGAAAVGVSGSGLPTPLAPRLHATPRRLPGPGGFCPPAAWGSHAPVAGLPVCAPGSMAAAWVAGSAQDGSLALFAAWANAQHTRHGAVVTRAAARPGAAPGVGVGAAGRPGGAQALSPRPAARR
jgi:hypothetical protein